MTKSIPVALPLSTDMKSVIEELPRRDYDELVERIQRQIAPFEVKPTYNLEYGK